MVLSALIFAVGVLTLRRRPWQPRLGSWLAVGLSATVAGILVGIAAERMTVESLGVGGWIRWGTWLVMAILVPLLCAHALMAGRSLPTFLALLGPSQFRTVDRVAMLLGLAFAISALLGVESALGLVFDPRYRDFPFAPLTMVAVPLAAVMTLNRPQLGMRPITEAVFAGVFLVATVYTAFNEGPNNWQSLWTCAGFALFGLTLWRARGERSPG